MITFHVITFRADIDGKCNKANYNNYSRLLIIYKNNIHHDNSKYYIY